LTSNFWGENSGGGWFLLIEQDLLVGRLMRERSLVLEDNGSSFARMSHTCRDETASCMGHPATQSRGDLYGGPPVQIELLFGSSQICCDVLFQSAVGFPANMLL